MTTKFQNIVKTGGMLGAAGNDFLYVGNLDGGFAPDPSIFIPIYIIGLLLRGVGFLLSQIALNSRFIHARLLKCLLLSFMKKYKKARECYMGASSLMYEGKKPISHFKLLETLIKTGDEGKSIHEIMNAWMGTESSRESYYIGATEKKRYK